MNLHGPLIHFSVDKGFLPNCGINQVNPPSLTSRSNKGYLPLKYSFPLTAAILGDYVINFQAKPKDNLKKSFKVSSKLQQNDSSSGSSQRGYEGKPDAPSKTFESKHNYDDSYVKSSDSCFQPEECTDWQSSPKQELSEDLSIQQPYLNKLRAVLLHVFSSEQWNASRLKMCNGTYLASAKNLVHYLGLQCLDVQQVEDDLSLGLLNLECTKSSIVASVTAAIQLLENSTSDYPDGKQHTKHKYIGDYVSTHESEKIEEFSISAMRRRAFMHASALFGLVQDKKGAHIMVTVGREVIANEMLLGDLLTAGANILRINCTHDDPSIWSEIIRLAKHNSQMLEKPCRILMDLAGPKLRTGSLKTGPNVMKISPKKDAKGDVIFPCQVWLSCPGCGPPSHISADSVLFVKGNQFINRLEVGKELRFVDVRGRWRSLQVSKKFSVFAGNGYIAECSKTAYVESGTKLYIKRRKRQVLIGQVVNIPAAESFIRLRVGDLLTISRDPSLSTDALGGNAFGSPRITCDSGRLFDSVKSGDPIAFDDGKIWGVIQGTSINEVIVQITHASQKGSKLGSEKSINIPKSQMQFEGLTSKDLVDLEFVAANADMVGISFIRDVRDVVIVMQELEKRKIQNLGVVLKIETHGAFEKLPLLLLQAMQSPNPFGIMIARGDLAVECGWDQMASIQEEILSTCNAAHVPVIWATQVLDTLAKTGIPTRAEITDVSRGMRANCIMLNKGEYIVKAVSMLDSILRGRSTKKNDTSLLKPPLPFSNI